jgi:hypothetical protein
LSIIQRCSIVALFKLDGGQKGNVKRIGIVVGVVLFLLVGVPAYAYGDPSGGTLFQILMPALAAIWGISMIFVGRMQRYLAGLIRKLRGVEVESDKPPAAM